MTELAATRLTLAGRLAGADFRLSPGELVVIVGPNGSGKSSLMRLLAGQGRADSGSVSLDGRQIGRFGPRERARRLAYLPQRAEIAWPIAVADMVALGRFAFGGAEVARGADDATRWLDEVGCAPLARRSTATLSGGELALVALARVFAAEAPLLLLDEPVAALDPRRQIDVMTRLAARSRAGQGIAVILHDLNLAAQFADRILWMKAGRIVAETSPDPDPIAAHAADVFDVAIHVEPGEGDRTSGLYLKR
ncbi:ABC transporter ATP-binding protein [Sphingopyxis sp. NJF-3]